MNNDEANISIYGDNTQAEDFPVLKAFQQYIDAEQEKARKRMVALSAIFGAIMIVLVVAFLFVVSALSSRSDSRIQELDQRNQLLNEKLVEFALKQQERGNSDNGASALKAVTESLAQLQTQMINQQREAMKGESEIQVPSVSEAGRAEAAKLRKAKDLIEKEKAKLAAEKERLHKEQVDLQRRRLYPEYYAKQDAAQASANAKTAKPKTTKKLRRSAEEIAAMLKEIEAEQDDEADFEEELDDDSAINYFEDEEAFTIPVEKKKSGSKSRFSIPLK